MKTETIQNPQNPDHLFRQFVLENDRGTAIKLLNFGGIITSFNVKLPDGSSRDIVLGFDDPVDYTFEHPYFGAVVGRYANRIARGRFTIDGKEYILAQNNGKNHLHGGINGFDKKFWDAETETGGKGDAVYLHYLSPDGEEGYPGNLDVEISFLLTPENELVIEYRAKTDKPTYVNLTHHDYFNLGDHRNTVYGHEIQIDASQYLEVNDELIPTGNVYAVANTPVDFRQVKPMGAGMDKVAPGYDHCFVLNHAGVEPGLAVRVRNPENGLVLEMMTTVPGVQFYTGNFLDGSITGKNGIAYQKHSAFCLEAQHFPDSPHHDNFPDTLLLPDREYYQKTIYRVYCD